MGKVEITDKTKSIISWTITIVVCLVIAKLFTTYVVRSVEVDGYSMSTTLSDGDKALTDAIFYKFNDIERFDIVIIKKESGSLKNQELVKRVIALPGETIEYKNGVLKELAPFIKERRAKKVDEKLEKEIKKIVNKNKSKTNKVKPGYKKKMKLEIEKAKKKRKREIIKEDIKKRQIERAIKRTKGEY